jgi:Arc/MetJ family transcription regulator
VADLKREQFRRLARLGAVARLAELRQEEAAIRQAFPDLFRGRGRRAGALAQAAEGSTGPRRRRRSAMTAAARKAVSERMKRYWAERKRKGK